MFSVILQTLSVMEKGDQVKGDLHIQASMQGGLKPIDRSIHTIAAYLFV